LHPDGNRVVAQSSSNSNCGRIQRAFEDEFEYEYDLVAATPRCVYSRSFAVDLSIGARWHYMLGLPRPSSMVNATPRRKGNPERMDTPPQNSRLFASIRG
jgi:hypothetical protein